MARHSLQPAEVEALQRVFDRHQAVEAVYLFGSRVSGKMSPESDLDLAVCTEDNATGSGLRLDLLADLTREGFDHVDLVFMADADLVLQYEMVRQNCLIYQTPAFSRGHLYSHVVRKYLDFLPYLERQREAYRRRLTDG